jgi:pimeloyl-ACP methyl ester carboxylesterase
MLYRILTALLLSVSLLNGAAFVRKHIPTDEGDISYEIRRGAGPALVLIHGSFNDNRQWDALLPTLDPDLTLVLIELRGHGASWPPPAHGSIEQFAKDAVRAMEAENIRRFYVGGHSIGGMVALEIGRMAPYHVLGIISIEGWTNHHALTDAFGNNLRTTLTPEEETRRLADRRRGTGNWTDEQRKTFAQIWRHWDGYEFLQSTTLPIVEVYGDRGRAKPTLEQLKIPVRQNIQVQWIANGSHSLPLQAPGELAAIMNTFVRATQAMGPSAPDRNAKP